MNIEKEEAIRHFVIEKLKNADIAHGYGHIKCVVNMAKKIAIAEKANIRIVVPAAYLHDIVPRNEAERFDLHTEESANEAMRFLKSMDFSRHETDEIAGIEDLIGRKVYSSFNSLKLVIIPLLDNLSINSKGTPSIPRIIILLFITKLKYNKNNIFY